MCLVEVRYEEGAAETYVLAERLADPDVARGLLRKFQGATVPTEAGGALVFRPTHVLASVLTERSESEGEAVSLLRGEQSNTSIRFGDALIMKLFRRVQFGPNPEVEVGWFLTEHSHFRGTPPLVGSATYVDASGREASLAILQGFERNRGDAWTTTLARLRDVLDGGEPFESLSAMARLGRTTGELHLALAGGDREFEAEPITDADVTAWRQAIVSEIQTAVKALDARRTPVDVSPLMVRVDGIAALRGALKTRHHGDYHLGQVLEREDGTFVIIDFEGEPAKPLAQRRDKRSPLRDVAGMLRSFDYARHAALGASATISLPLGRVATAADWYVAAREAFLSEYLTTVRLHPGLMPSHTAEALAALELEKAAYEVLYELNNRPDWLAIPLAALTSV